MKITEVKENDIIDEVFNQYANRFFPGQRQEFKDALHAVFTHLREDNNV